MSHGRLPARRLSLATIAAALIAASAPAIAQMGPGPGRDDRGFERGPGMDRGGRFERDGRRGRDDCRYAKMCRSNGRIAAIVIYAR